MATTKRYSRQPAKTANNKYAGSEQLLAFLQRNAVMVLAIIALGPWVYKYLSKMLASIEEQELEQMRDKAFEENKDPNVLEAKLDAILQDYSVQELGGHSKEDIKSAARKLSHDLGTIYSDTNSIWSYFDPRGWFENDEEAKNTLATYGNAWIPLAACYYCITRSRGLAEDVQKLLDADSKAQLEAAGINYF